jgi:hypothetical protein
MLSEIDSLYRYFLYQLLYYTILYSLASCSSILFRSTYYYALTPPLSTTRMGIHKWPGIPLKSTMDLQRRGVQTHKEHARHSLVESLRLSTVYYRHSLCVTSRPTQSAGGGLQLNFVPGKMTFGDPKFKSIVVTMKQSIDAA